MVPSSLQPSASASSEAPRSDSPRTKACLWGHRALKDEEALLFQTLESPWHWPEDAPDGPAPDVVMLRDLANERPLRWAALRHAIQQASPRAIAELLRTPPSPTPAELLVRAAMFRPSEDTDRSVSGANDTTEDDGARDRRPEEERLRAESTAQSAEEDESPWGVWEAVVARIAKIQQDGPTALHPLTLLLWESRILGLPRDREGHFEPPDGRLGATGWSLTNTRADGEDGAGPRAAAWIAQVFALTQDARAWLRTRRTATDWTDPDRRQLVALTAASAAIAHQLLPATPAIEVRMVARVLSAQPALHPEAFVSREAPYDRPDGEQAGEEARSTLPLWTQQRRLEEAVRPGYFRWESIVSPELHHAPRPVAAQGPYAQSDRRERSWEERLSLLAALDASPAPRDRATQARLARRLLDEAQAPEEEAPTTAQGDAGVSAPAPVPQERAEQAARHEEKLPPWWSLERERADDAQERLRQDPGSQTTPPAPAWDRRLAWLADWVVSQAPRDLEAAQRRHIAHALELHIRPWLAGVEPSPTTTPTEDGAQPAPMRPHTLHPCARAEDGDAATAQWRQVIKRLLPVLITTLGPEGRELAIRLITGFPSHLSTVRGQLIADPTLDPRLVWAYWQQRTATSLKDGVRMAPHLPPEVLAVETPRLRELMAQRLGKLHYAQILRPEHGGAVMNEAATYLGTPLRTLEEVRDALRLNVWNSTATYLAMIQHPEAGLDPECRALLAKGDDPVLWSELVRRNPEAPDIPDLIPRFIAAITHGSSRQAASAWDRLHVIESTCPDVLDRHLSLAALRALLLHPTQAVRLWAVRRIGQQSDRERVADQDASTRAQKI